MQIIENWTCITGMVLAWGHTAPTTAGDGKAPQVTLQLRIEEARAIEGLRNLVPEKSGDTIVIVMPGSFDTKGLAITGKRVTLPVRMVRRGKYFADPDWSFAKGSSKCGPNPSTKD